MTQKGTGKDVIFTEDVVIEGVLTVNSDIETGSGVDGSIDVNDSSDVLQERLDAVNDNYSKGLYQSVGSESLADDAEVTIFTGKAGFGWVNIGDDQERSDFSFSTTAVTLGANASANTANSDSDTDLCIYYSGTDLMIKNRLGSELTVRYEVRGS